MKKLFLLFLNKKEIRLGTEITVQQQEPVEQTAPANQDAPSSQNTTNNNQTTQPQTITQQPTTQPVAPVQSQPTRVIIDEKPTVYVMVEGLKLRDKPGLSGTKVLGQLPLNTALSFLGQKTDTIEFSHILIP